MSSPSPRGLHDSFGRKITYLRVSVTDRCDLRCRYCMAETMTFLPRADLMTMEEIGAIVDRFVARGVRKVRLTGGEPLVRGGIADLADRLGRHLELGDLDELTLTTNGTRLDALAERLSRAGIRRVNVSLDTLDPERFRQITRRGDLTKTLTGIAAAQAAGLRVKINMVALKGLNDDEIGSMLRWCAAQGHDLTLIETMPLGEIEDDRTDRYLPLTDVRQRLEQSYTLTPVASGTGGPARYFDVRELGARLGLITPMTQNFCEGCNRVRLTAEGRLYTCLGHDDYVDLRAAFRSDGIVGVDAKLDEALRHKPRRHDFRIASGSDHGPTRHMSVTGG